MSMATASNAAACKEKFHCADVSSNLDVIHRTLGTVAYFIVVWHCKSRPVEIYFDSAVAFSAFETGSSGGSVAENEHSLIVRMQNNDLLIGVEGEDEKPFAIVVERSLPLFKLAADVGNKSVLKLNKN